MTIGPSSPSSPSWISGLYTYAEFGVCLAGFLPMMGLSHLRHRGDPTQRQPGRWMRRLGRTTSALTPLWQFTVEGTPPPDIDHKGYVVVSNHASQADPFLLSWLPWDMRWVAKQELYDQPVIGWAMKLSGDIPIRRGDRESVVHMMDECERTIAAGMSVMLFPEGTRSKDDTLLPFKDGAFELAIASGAPVLPVAIHGTRDCRPKHSKWFGAARATARILAPIRPTRQGAEGVAELRDAARAAIQSAVNDLSASRT